MLDESTVVYMVLLSTAWGMFYGWFMRHTWLAYLSNYYYARISALTSAQHTTYP